MATRIVKAIFADVPPGAIIRYEGYWGVVLRGSGVDFWDQPRRTLKEWAVVEVLVER
jgi:hypothetical protein